MRYNKPQGRYSIKKKKTYYSQFNTLATRWASKAEKGELFAGYDGNNYKIVIATGDDYLYESYKTIDANNEAMIEYYEEFIKENNEEIRSHRNANSVFKSIEAFSKVLKSLMLSKDGTIAIALMLQEDNQMIEMVEYIKNNPNATESEILKKAVEINEA